MNLGQDKKDVFDLIKGAYKGEIMLPDFQRPFVRDKEGIEGLLISLIEDSFIGIFLLCEVNPNDPIFKTIEIDGARMVNNEYKEYPKTIVLDGQQRLTSLFYAVYEPEKQLKGYVHPYRFFINLNALLNQDSIDDDSDDNGSVISMSTNSSKYKKLLNDKGLYSIETLKEKGLFPVGFLKNGGFADLWYENNKWGFDDDEARFLKEKIENIINYQVYTISIGINEDINEIAKLFERINNTGVKLSTFDLLTARLYKFINLRKCWEESYTKNHYISKFSGSDIRDSKTAHYIIQAITLSKGYTSVKAKDILKITEEDINSDIWNNVTTILESFLEKFFQVSEYGITEEKNITYKNMIVVFLALLLNDLGNFDRDKINKRYWASLLLERYGGSTDSKLYADYQNLRRRINGGDEMSIVSDAKKLLNHDGLSLKEKSYSGSAIYKAVVNILFRNNPCDFYRKDDIKFNDLDDHHIFPIKFLERKGIINSKDINTILNKTLILPDTNRWKISDKSPHAYISEMINVRGSRDQVVEVLKRHLISEEMFDLLFNSKEDSSDQEIYNNYDKFLFLREQIIIKQFKELLGMAESDDDLHEKIITPETPYSNHFAIIETIQQCEGYIQRMDKYFNEEGIKQLERGISNKIRNIQIITTPTNITEETRKLFKLFSSEAKNKYNIDCELRVLMDTQLMKLWHDRYILADNIAFSVPSPDSIKRGQISHINKITKIPDFEKYWNESKDIFSYWHEVLKFQEKKILGQ